MMLMMMSADHHRLVRNALVTVTADVPRYRGRCGRVIEFNGGEVGVEFAAHRSVVWFRPTELTLAG